MLKIIFLQHSNSRSSRAAFEDKYEEDDPRGNDFFSFQSEGSIYNSSRNSVLKSKAVDEES